jgi:hypothetical protein
MSREAKSGHVAIDVDVTVAKAWASLPPAHRKLLEVVGASQWCIVDQPIGDAVNELRVSAQLSPLGVPACRRLAPAYGAWIKELRVVLIRGTHPGLRGLSATAAEAFIAHLAWHEWGHALSVERCSRDDIFDGRRLLQLCPRGVREDIRGASYGPSSYTHEIVAEIYALLMERQMRGEGGQPLWLDKEIYNLVRRVTGWTE